MSANNSNIIRLGNGTNLDLRKITTGQKIDDLGLNADEIRVFERFAGPDRTFDKNEIEQFRQAIYEYTYYAGDMELSDRDANRAMKKQDLKD